MKKICCVCHKTETLNGWTVRNTKAGEKISHGYCPVCFQHLLAKIASYAPTGKRPADRQALFSAGIFDKAA